jgi:hypothetical protein
MDNIDLSQLDEEQLNNVLKMLEEMNKDLDKKEDELKND